MAGVCCGLGLGTKYNGLIVLMLLTALVALTVFRRSPEGAGRPYRAMATSVLFLAVAGSMYLPWGIKNYLWTGNPVYPLFDQWFNAAAPYEVQSVPPLLLRKILYGESWWHILLVPLRIFFQGRDDVPQYFDGKLNPALLVLPVLAFWAVNRGTGSRQPAFEKSSLALFAIFYILFVFFQTNMRARYTGPAIACLVILSMFGLENLHLMMKKHWPGIRPGTNAGLSGLVLLVVFSGNVLYLVDQFQIVAPVPYLKGEVSRDQYIERFRPEYATIQYANRQLPAESRILALFLGKRGYYSERAMHFDIDQFHRAVQASNRAEDMRRQIVEMGFSHMLIRFDMLDKWCHDNLNKKEKQMVNNFFQDGCKHLFSKNGHGLFQLSQQQ
jgi:hypothetical protein